MDRLGRARSQSFHAASGCRLTAQPCDIVARGRPLPRDAFYSERFRIAHQHADAPNASTCCARTASGHAAVVPPRSVMNLRRFMCSPETETCLYHRVAGNVALCIIVNLAANVSCGFICTIERPPPDVGPYSNNQSQRAAVGSTCCAKSRHSMVIVGQRSSANSAERSNHGDFNEC
jgi:hypothetical protein